MKIKSVLLGVVIAAIILLLFVPLPTTGVKIAYLLDFIYGLVIVGFGMYAAFKKKIPTFFSRVLLFFSTYSLVLNVAAVRYLFLYKIEREEIPIISKTAEEIIISSPIAGYILFAVGVFVTFYSVFRYKITQEDDLAGSIKFLRGTTKMMILLFFVSIVGCWAIGFSKLELNYIESFTFYIPYICTQFLIYILPLTMAGVGINLLNWINRDSK